MKKILLSFLTILTVNISSQTLTQSFNEPKPGDLDLRYPLDTSAFLTGLPVGVTGNNCTWNFTNLNAIDFVDTTAYLSPSAVTNSASFPGCTVVNDQGGVYTFMKSTTTPTTQTEILGITLFTLAINFTNSAVAAKYPVNYGSSTTDNLSGTFTASLTGTCSGKITTDADGLGTLNLPNGFTFSNVLRVKSVQTISLTALILQVGTIKQTVYNYYHSSKKFPILSLNYQSINSVFGSTVTAFASGNKSSFVVGLKENTLNEEDLTIYPNPTKNNFKLTLSNKNAEPCFVEIYDLVGQKVKSLSLKNSTFIEENIEIAELSPGIYIIKANLGQKSLARRLLVE